MAIFVDVVMLFWFAGYILSLWAFVRDYDDLSSVALKGVSKSTVCFSLALGTMMWPILLIMGLQEERKERERRQ